eukprot:5476750-Prymnesium_polylepis.1
MPGITPPACFCARAPHSPVPCDATQVFSRTLRADAGTQVCARLEPSQVRSAIFTRSRRLRAA